MSLYRLYTAYDDFNLSFDNSTQQTLATPPKVNLVKPVNKFFYTLQFLFETIFCKVSIFLRYFEVPTFFGHPLCRNDVMTCFRPWV